MTKRENKINIGFMKKKYFYKNSIISPEQIPELMKLTKDYIASVNLNHDTKFNSKILQSTIALIIDKYDKKLEQMENK